MRFKAKVIHPDPQPADKVGELELPGDLAALGDQLRDDASHLAEIYPAEFYDRVMESKWALSAIASDSDCYVTRAAAEKRKARRRSFAVVASVLVLLVAAPLTLLLVMQPDKAPATADAPDEPAPATQLDLSHSVATDIPRSPLQDIPAIINTAPPAFGNTQEVLFIHRAPGPELDAWLDVLEQADSGTTTLSM